MSKAVTTLSLWDDRRTPGDIANGQPDLKISTMAEGQFRIEPTDNSGVVINSSQAVWLANFLIAGSQEGADD